jgi:GntR family transcriptional regulator/MocR family aminotransferase
MALALAEMRKRIHLGSPGYLDFEMVSHPVDQDGIDVSGAHLGQDDVLYIMPEHLFPQCVTLIDERRTAIKRMSMDDKLLVIENDYDSEY